MHREDRDGHAALDNEAIGRRTVMEAGRHQRRASCSRTCAAAAGCSRAAPAPERRFELTRKGRGRARALQRAGAAPDEEARVSEPDELLDLIYADSTPSAISFSGDGAERVPGVWHRPTVQAAARLDHRRFCELETALRDAGLIGAQIHSYGTLTPTGEHHARERWHATRPVSAFGGPPRLARPYRRAGSVVARLEDRACPNCGAHASWLARRKSKRWDESARARRGRLHLPALRRALDGLPRAHGPRRGVRAAR